MLTKEQINKLPKGYLSWSSMDLMERSPMEWVDTYIKGQPRFVSEAMFLGKKFADAMEVGVPEDEKDPAFRFLVEIGIPKYERSEFKIKAKWKGIPLLSVLDTAKVGLSAYREYKTGTQPWTQSRVDNHSQLIFYAAVIFIKTGKLPKCHLDWIETVYDETEMELKMTGNHKSFVRAPFTLLEIHAMFKRIEKTVEGIAELVDQYGPVK